MDSSRVEADYLKFSMTSTDDTLDFCTLGMFIIDEIHFPPPKQPVINVLGGAGTYSALGARLFSPPPLALKVGWVVHAGSDFPEELRDTIRSWNTSCLLANTPNRLTTRGFNEYGHDEYRAFRYSSPKLRLDHNSLPPSHLQSKCFHLICSPSRCIDLVNNILVQREKVANKPGLSVPRPLFVWEPVPDLCLPEELEKCFQALQYVDVISPNHQELAAFFGESSNIDDEKLMKRLCENLLKRGFRDSPGAVIVRTGKRGCYIAEASGWTTLPAYFSAPSKNYADVASNERVVDPTGGGNAFLGGFCVALARGKKALNLSKYGAAAVYGSVAASFAIEQVGVPVLQQSKDSRELWNGESVFDRLEKFEKHLVTNEKDWHRTC